VSAERKTVEQKRAEWREELERALSRSEDDLPDHPDIWEDEARRLVATARHLGGYACLKCGGIGRCVYSDTSTWRGGAGGQSLTESVCDRCWGTGRTDETGIDLRRLLGGAS